MQPMTLIRRVSVGSVVAMVVSLVGVASPAQATFPGPNGRIAFDGTVGNTAQIFSVEPDGTGLQQLTHVAHGGLAFGPGWSADSTRIAFSRHGKNDLAQLWVMNADGSNAIQLTHDPNHQYEYPKFSPDGSRLVFSRCLPGFGCGIAVAKAKDGRGVHQLTKITEDRFDIESDYSPVGTAIAFRRFNAGGIVSAVYVMDSNGTDLRQITPARVEGFSPSWSPDGARIAFSSNCCRDHSAIWMVNADGTGLQQITHPAAHQNDILPAFSPQGDKLVFDSDRNGSCCDLFTVEVNGTGLALLTTNVEGPFDAQWGSAP